MTQASPSALLYQQASVMIGELLAQYKTGTLQTVDELSAQLRDILSRYQLSAGHPIMEFEALSQGEPPLSAKMNRFWKAAKHDVDILQQQVDVLRASAIFVHNSVVMDINRAKQDNAKLRNKINTLQLYSQSTDTSVITFKENFGSLDFVDTDLVPTAQQCAVLENSYLSLGRQADLKDLGKTGTVKVLSTSNGFSGNNQEIKDPSTATTNPVTHEKIYEFVGQTQRAADTTGILDGQPNTWFEYEHCLVPSESKLAAGNLNFEYEKSTASGRSEVSWADGPDGGVLKLDLEIDLTKVQTINYLTYTPYGLANNANYPVEVTLIQTSENGTEWQPVAPQHVFVGSASDTQTARSAANVSIGTTVWSFQERDARYVRISLQQASAINANIGHLYYVTKDTSQRAKGPVPSIDDPTKDYGPSKGVSGSLIQKREFFPGKRWAIAMRDIAVQQVQYYSKSSMISKPILTGGVIDKVTIDADMYIPPEFGSTFSWVRFYISPDNGNKWIQISRVTDDYLGIPEVLAFNDPTPAAFREKGVQYVSTTNPVTSIRVKVEMDRPSTLTASTPLVRSYTVRIKKR